MPATPLRLLGGDMAEELLLTGRRVLPDKAQASGFKFRHENLRSALSEILPLTPKGQRTVGLDRAPEMQHAQ
jgi:NAD dependent epimerase/dehydratase family enzyme